MKHYTCDLCGRVITGERYSASVRVDAVAEQVQVLEEDQDVHPLDLLTDEIEKLENTSEFTTPTGPQRFEFDLCGACCQQYVRDPLQRGTRPAIKFSSN